MIDLLSNGRLEAGFVVGGGPEYYNFDVSPTSARDRFAEALSLVRRAWSEPGPFRWDGEHYQYDCVNPWPRPAADPSPTHLGVWRRKPVDVGDVRPGGPRLHGRQRDAGPRRLRRPVRVPAERCRRNTAERTIRLGWVG